MAVMEIRLGEVYRLRKPHPCGGYDWQVTRVGADIGLRCLTCDRRVMLARPEFERRVKRLVSPPATPDGVPAADQPGAPPPRP